MEFLVKKNTRFSLMQKNLSLFILILFLLNIYPQSLISLPLKATKGFDRLLKTGERQVDFLNPLIGGVIFQKNQGLIENLVDYGQTKKTARYIDSIKGSHEKINVPSHPFALLAQRMFHRPTRNDRFTPTKIDPFFRCTVKSIENQLYILGWLCALVCKGEDIAFQAKRYQILSKKIYDTPDQKTLARLKDERDKQSPDVIRFTKACQELLDINDLNIPVEVLRLVIKACNMSSRVIGLGRTRSEIVHVYQKQLPLILITSYVYAQAQSKHDLTEFVRGFFDHYKEIESTFTPYGIKILSSKKERDLFDEMYYTKEDIEKILELRERQKPFVDPMPVFFQHVVNVFKDNNANRGDEESQTPTISDVLYIGALSDEKIINCNIETKDGHVCDCAECGILFLVKTILYNENKEDYDVTLLPESIQENQIVKEFLNKFQSSINNLDARTWWFYLFSDLEDKHNKADFVYASKKHFYELEPEAENVRKALSLFFSVQADTFEELGRQLSSCRQTVSFVVNEHNHQQVEITMTITSLDKQEEKEASIVVSWHQHIEIKEESSLDKYIFYNLIRHALKKQPSDFPFNIILSNNESVHHCSLFHSFSLRSGFEMLCRIDMNGIASKKAQRELFNLESITLNHRSFEEAHYALATEIAFHLIRNLNERPFKNLIESLKPVKILDLFCDRDVFTLIRIMDHEWIKANAAALAPVLFGPKNCNYYFMSEFAHNPTTVPYCYFTESVDPKIILLGIVDADNAKNTINSFSSAMGSHWFTDRADAMWQEIKDSKDALRRICFYMNKPLTQAIVEKIGVNRFLDQIAKLSEKGFDNLFQCLISNLYHNEIPWLKTNIKEIWNIAKSNRTHLKCFTHILITASQDFLQDCFTHISFTEFFAALCKNGLLEKTIDKCSHAQNQQELPLYKLLTEAQKKYKNRFS